jgi:hypothetical protein
MGCWGKCWVSTLQLVVHRLLLVTTSSGYPNCQCLKPSLWGWCIQIYTTQWWFWLILGVPTPLLVQTAAASSLGAHGASLGGVTRNRQPWLEVPIRIPNFWLKNTYKYKILRYIRFIYLYQISFASCKLRFKQELCPLTINRRVLAPQESCSAAWRGCCDLNIRPAPPPSGWASTISWALFSLFFLRRALVATLQSKPASWKIFNQHQ